MTELAVYHRYIRAMSSRNIPAVSGRLAHIRQGQLDSACGLHCAAMGLTLLGHLKRPFDLLKRRTKVSAKLWSASISNYFEGMSALELATAIRSLDLNLAVSWRKGNHPDLAKLVPRHVQNGSLAIVGWCSRDERFDHWVVVVGVEIRESAGKPVATALLCLDPSEEAPHLSEFNTRIELQGNPALYGSKYARYSGPGGTLPIRLHEVVFLANLNA